MAACCARVLLVLLRYSGTLDWDSVLRPTRVLSGDRATAPPSLSRDRATAALLSLHFGVELRYLHLSSEIRACHRRLSSSGFAIPGLVILVVPWAPISQLHDTSFFNCDCFTTTSRAFSCCIWIVPFVLFVRRVKSFLAFRFPSSHHSTSIGLRHLSSLEDLAHGRDLLSLIRLDQLRLVTNVYNLAIASLPVLRLRL